MSDDGNESRDSKNTETEEKSSPTSPSHAVESKIDVLLKPAGDAPIMKKKKWAVDRNKRIGWVGEFIKKYLKLTAQDSVFLYVNQSFAPTPDTEIGSVFDKVLQTSMKMTKITGGPWATSLT
uniref:Ubiquitin-like protein ATG12 n=1 Tax=Crassostrea virginica TaxID=6565 RepID=A0A8B8CNV7_CRAVI|nr:ubiquitin-like protein ATG12 isoform X1 [Crassostrea virginica]